MRLILLALAFLSLPARADDLGRWRAQAVAVTITRDDWGIAHAHGKTDADAVFGMVYAQAEDDFNRVEANYLTALGRTAEAEGEGAIWADLRQKLFIDPADLKAKYAASPAWLKSLMDGWAGGLNYYLATHPDVHPRVIAHFEPWMALSFSEGSIGGDIERIDLDRLKAFYGGVPMASLATPAEIEPSGSNGFAIAPSNSASGHALLWINPHTSFFFRSEQQVSSDEGLNAYGAATWGQFFIYQGFNANAGWMHTSSGVDNVDEFAETIVRQDGGLFYRHGAELRPVTAETIVIPYRTAGGMAERRFTVYRTHHGPIVRSANGKWVAVALMNTPVAALEQSFLRTKASDYASFLKVADLKANSSNDTIFADAKGEIAYLHPQFVPVRDDRFDYSQPVDGSDPATDWKGLHALDTLPRLLNPKVGWLMNVNDSPWWAAAGDSPRAKDFPRYMDIAGENMRGLHATAVLNGKRGFTPETLRDAAFDSHLPGFALLLPGLFAAYDALPPGDPMRSKLAGQIALLRAWDLRWSADSGATSLAIHWGERLWTAAVVDQRKVNAAAYDQVMRQTGPAQKLKALADASNQLVADWGRWNVGWGEINRFQRRTGDITQTFLDDRPSIPVPFASAKWGSLASFGAKPYPGTRRWYGTSGNSFVAVVEFGPKVRALAVTAGGESGDPGSRHFGDQAERYAAGRLREVYFYPEQLKGHTERRYRPGE